MEHWVIHHKGYRAVWAGAITSHPGFKGWRKGKHTAAFVMAGKRLCDADLRLDVKSETGLCAMSCKKADPTTACHCICAGQNHGIHYEVPTMPEPEV